MLLLLLLLLPVMYKICNYIYAYNDIIIAIITATTFTICKYLQYARYFDKHLINTILFSFLKFPIR